MKKVFLLLATAAICSLSAKAQTADYPWAIGLYGVKTEYLGDLRRYNVPTTGSSFNYMVNTIYNFKMLHLGGALSFDRYLNRFFDVGLYASYSSLGFDHKDGDYNFQYRNFEVKTLGQLNLHTRFKFLGNDDAKWIPYLTAGAGALYYGDISRKLNAVTGDFFYPAAVNPARETYATVTQKNEDSPVFAGIVSLGAGIEYRINDNWGIRYQVDWSYTSKDDVDFYEYPYGDKNDMQLQHNLGVTYSFGKKKDSDGDGVYDKKDKCPNTPAGVKVDINGCPIDADSDGLADYLDKCPAEAGTIEGCPDTDNDGVIDKNDKCPDTPAGIKVDANGCPFDTDKDGVYDYLDKCPNTPAGVKVDADGCPVDADGDGIADYLDKCPAVKGIPENNGCPEVKAEVKQAFQKALHGIQFETGKYDIKKASYPVLDGVVKALTDNPDYQIDIKGHTDNVGKPESNLTLSQSRADAVKNYLVQQGIAESRIKAEGFGDTKPVADNATKEGKAQNRRVEFIVNFER